MWLILMSCTCFSVASRHTEIAPGCFFVRIFSFIFFFFLLLLPILFPLLFFFFHAVIHKYRTYGEENGITFVLCEASSLELELLKPYAIGGLCSWQKPHWVEVH